MSDALPVSVIRAVDHRDQTIDRMTGRFVGVGRNLHHRKLRSRGGLNTAGNLVTLNGSGTTGSHGWVHANPTEATRVGLMVPSWIEDPAKVPALLADPYGRQKWALLRDDGTQLLLTNDQGEHIMFSLGIWNLDDVFKYGNSAKPWA